MESEKSKMRRPLIVTFCALAITSLMALEWRVWRHWSPNEETNSEMTRDSSGWNQTVKEESPPNLGDQRQQTAASASHSNFGSVIDSPVNAIKAQLSPVNETKIAAEISGRILRLPVQEGESFSKGELLVEFDCHLQRAQLQRVTAQAEIASRNHTANQRLLERGAVSKLEAENSASERTRALAEVKELTVLVDKCQITAPYAGKVAVRMTRAEEFVQAGQPLLEILDDSAMELEFIVPSAWISWLKKEYSLSILMDETNKTYPARITRVGAKIDSISRTVKVVAVIQGTNDELMPGMSGTIYIGAPTSRTGGLQ